MYPIIQVSDKDFDHISKGAQNFIFVSLSNGVNGSDDSFDVSGLRKGSTFVVAGPIDKTMIVCTVIECKDIKNDISDESFLYVLFEVGWTPPVSEDNIHKNMKSMTLTV